MKKWIENFKPSLSSMIQMFRDVLKALRHVHSIRVGSVVATHCDVKLTNILIDTERNRAVLADFDVARASTGDTTLGMAPGTERFIAPEVRRGGPTHVSPQSDMFSLGVTMVAALLPDVWETRMPTTTAEVLTLFDKGGEAALSNHLLDSTASTLDASTSSAGGGGAGGDGGGAAADAASSPSSTSSTPKPTTAATVPSVDDRGRARSERHVALLDWERRKQLFDLLPQLLSGDPSKRLSADEALDHPLFQTLRLVEAPKDKPATKPRMVGGGGCKVYTAVHSGEHALAQSWEQLHFNEAAAQFHLMMGAQRGARAREVLIVVNETLSAQFEKKKETLRDAGKATSEVWVFHGTGSQANIDSILSDGFRVGGEGVAIQNGAAYGRGVYTATGPDTPMSSYAHNTRQVILSRALPGHQSAPRRDSDDVDMWRPRPDWAVFADAKSLLPVYVVKY